MMNTTIDTERESLLSFYSDAHKDARGFRPTDWETIRSKSTAELRADIEHFAEEMKLEEEIQMREQAEQQELWWKHIEGIMQDNGVDRGTALRWDMEAMDALGDIGFYCFLWGLNFKLEGVISEHLKNCG